MGQISIEQLSAIFETASFNAEVHLNLFKWTFKFYNLDFFKWCVCFIGDNASKSLRGARKSVEQHVGCTSNKVNLEVNAMVYAQLHFQSLILSILYEKIWLVLKQSWKQRYALHYLHEAQNR